MSFKETYKTLRYKLNTKSNIVLSGNVDDLFFNQELDQNELSPLHEIVYQYFKKLNYDKVLLINRYGDDKQIGVSSNAPEEAPAIQLTEFFDKHFMPAKDTGEKVALIINFPEKEWNEKSQDQPHAGGQYDDQVVKMINKNFENGVKYIDDCRKIVMITKQPQSLFKRLLMDDIELSEILVSKPDLVEREELIEKFGQEFKLESNGLADKNSRDFKTAVALTDRLSNKEILQIARLSKSFKIPYETFKDLFNAFSLAKDKSPWEDLRIKSSDEIKERLSLKVKGQDKAVEHVTKTIIKAITGLSGIQHNTTRSKPKGIAFFVGPTGVGKTEMAKALTELVFEDESNLMRFDMSEYKQENSEQRLIGSPPGYVGYAEGGQLTNAVKEKPFSVVLFDEIEKAHPKIFDIFLQILEDGRLTSSKGEEVDFSETFIIFTSNIGAAKEKQNESPNYIEEVKAYFKDELGRPEIFGRINESNVVPFNRIDDSIAKLIASHKLEGVFKYISTAKNIELILSDKEKKYLVELIVGASDTLYGGRDVVNKIEDIIINPLAEYIFENEMNDLEEKINILIDIDRETGKISFKK